MPPGLEELAYFSLRFLLLSITSSSWGKQVYVFTSFILLFFLNCFIDPQLFLEWLSRQRRNEVTHKVLSIIEKKLEFNEGHRFFSILDFLILKPTD